MYFPCRSRIPFPCLFLNLINQFFHPPTHPHTGREGERGRERATSTQDFSLLTLSKCSDLSRLILMRHISKWLNSKWHNRDSRIDASAVSLLLTQWATSNLLAIVCFLLPFFFFFLLPFFLLELWAETSMEMGGFHLNSQLIDVLSFDLMCTLGLHKWIYATSNFIYAPFSLKCSLIYIYIYISNARSMLRSMHTNCPMCSKRSVSIPGSLMTHEEDIYISIDSLKILGNDRCDHFLYS